MGLYRPCIPKHALRPHRKHSPVGQKHVVRSALIHARHIKTSQIDAGISSRPIERAVPLPRPREGRRYAPYGRSQEERGPEAGKEVRSHPLQPQFASHETLTDMDVAVITAAY